MMNEEKEVEEQEGWILQHIRNFLDSQIEGSELKARNYPQILLFTPQLNYLQDELWMQSEAEKAQHFKLLFNNADAEQNSIT